MAIFQYCSCTACLSSPPAAVRGARLNSEAGGSFELGCAPGALRAVRLRGGACQITMVFFQLSRVQPVATRNV